MAVSINAFPGCCGIHIIANFGHTPTNPMGGEPTTAEVEEMIDYYEDHNFHTKGLVLIALNSEQKRVFSKTMTKYEFEPVVKDFYHPAHRSYITLYARKTFDSDDKKVVRKRSETDQKALAKKAAAVKKTNPTARQLFGGSWSTTSY